MVEALEPRLLLSGDMFTTAYEGMLPAGNYEAQLVGNFDGANGDDIASYNQTTGQWYVSLNDGTGNFTTTAWGTPYGTKTGWQTHVVGDFNGDNRDDIASYHPSNGTWWVNYANLAGNDFESWVNPITYATKAGWQSHLVGDYNGDGEDDIASYHPFNGTWWISYGDPTALNTGASALGFTQELNQIRYNTTRGWTEHVTGDFDGDGRDDVASFHPFNGSWWVSISDALATNTGALSPGFQQERMWANYVTNSGWTSQLVGDFNGDGEDDIANFHDSNNTWHVSLSNADVGSLSPSAQQSFSTRGWGELENRNWTRHLMGDFNDVAGTTVADDVASFDSSTGRWYVSLSNGGQFETDVWSDVPTNAGWKFQHAGDFTNSGADDGIMNFHPFNNSLWQSVPSFGFTNATNVAINDLATATSTITVAGLTGDIIDLNVFVDIDHPVIFQLSLVLVSPSGTQVALMFGSDPTLLDSFFDDEAAVAGSGIVAPFNTRLRPMGDLSEFDGEDPNGIWTLRVYDDTAGSTGTIDDWSLIIKSA